MMIFFCRKTETFTTKPYRSETTTPPDNNPHTNSIIHYILHCLYKMTVYWKRVKCQLTSYVGCMHKLTPINTDFYVNLHAFSATS